MILPVVPDCGLGFGAGGDMGKMAGGGLRGGGKGRVLLGREGNGSVKSLNQAIMEHAEGLPEDALIRAGDFLHLGNRAAGNRALVRLVAKIVA